MRSSNCSNVCTSAATASPTSSAPPAPPNRSRFPIGGEPLLPFHRIARIEDVPPGAARFFCVAGRSVVIANRAGEFFAVDGVCPHKGFELDHAQLWDNLLECPWHRYQYDIRTGENCFPKNVYPQDRAEAVEPIATYPLELRGQEIWVDLV